AQWGPDPAAA
nr:Chain C, Marker peptide [Homo sapiens]5HYJ_C Chain C, ALA-GLN-TRP-GLY-PRO-ASP-PRO-ALA-ALA-ALA [Homo sapiens]5HYJ_H Chain H, ALA-GLN-TRP-GLY-PRO-ASP-PRO-ALA-ALA-ALA [Homo sapiens]